LGNNSRLRASATEPLLLYSSNFDGNGSFDPLIGQHYLNEQGERASYPLHARDDVVKQLPMIKDHYVAYADFGRVTFTDLLQEEASSDSFLKVNQLQSCLLQKGEGGKYELAPLPGATQAAPIQTILPIANESGTATALFVGNDFTCEKNHGWYDAFNGLFLEFEQDAIQIRKSNESGFFVPGDSRSLIRFNNKNGEQLILVGQNRGELVVFKPNNRMQLWQ
ncbi:MAG: hypothetical protein AAGJ93_11745, partial [Bacteroidota bacterium]